MSNDYYKQKFYVFYDKNDNVRFCGTAKQLVEERIFKTLSCFYSSVSYINSRNVGKVYILK